MNIRTDEKSLAFAKFGIGQPVPRAEDPTLVRGEGRYTDDIDVPGQVYAAFVRSSHAHGILRGVDVDAARAMPGVLGVFTAADLADAGYKPLTSTLPLVNQDGSSMLRPGRPILATDKVRFVGEIIGFVVARTAAEARDAAEAVVSDIDAIPAVIGLEDAVAPGAPQLFDEVPGNVVLDFQTGNTAAVDAAFAAAAHVTRLHITNNRVVINAMEPRAGIGEYDPAMERYTFHVGCQGVFGQRALLAETLGIPVERLRILTGNVGGSFGMKSTVFPEYVCVLHAARVLGLPVKWADSRSDSFLGDTHGRDHTVEAALALDAEGRFLAIRAEVLGNMGAYLSAFAPFIATSNIARHFASVYATPLIDVSSRCVLTNTVSIGAYRGAGRPEGNYFTERLIETAAREMGLDPLAMRRLNHVRPEQMPYAAASGVTYDSGEFTGMLDEALDRADWNGYEARRAESQARGKLRGRGVGQYLEITAPPTREAGNIHFEDDGTVTIVTGTLDYGQGHWTPFAQVLVQTLGVPFEAVRLVQGDSDRLQAGGGTGGSKSIMASGTAIHEAGLQVIEKGKRAASHILEAAPVDIEFEAGRFSIAGTDRAIGIMELARQLKASGPLPEGVPDTLDVDHIHEASPSAFPNGCHICELEIDPDTGEVAIVKYTMVNDFGTMVNPLMVQGQLHGGVVQGIGQTLMESTVYDADGQLITGSFMDYAMPRADSAPLEFHFIDRGVPATTNPLGVKGCGEAGCAGSLPAIMNALVDALAPYGVKHLDMPATPLKLWRLMQDAPIA